MSRQLSTTNHDRDVAGLTYVYPVISRRAGGLSIGINVNTNNACNWRCIYCQVPGLTLGAPPALDLELLASELRWFLDSVLRGDFYQTFNVPIEHRCIKDIAISGNGEPTSVKEFPALLETLGAVLHEMQLVDKINKVLITNGSLLHRPAIQLGLEYWSSLGGEVWFKLDRATSEGRKSINNARQSTGQVLQNLKLAASLCPTKIQTCVFNYAGHPWSATEWQAYLQLLQQLQALPTLNTVMLYTLARPSHQPEAPLLQPMSYAEMQILAVAIEQLNFKVQISV